ncbi:MAG: ATP-binding protein [Arcicella sp.]|jgi:signal transduction histidine kinase|nr:ATP-binding protein [Arcicella sp.]
MAQNNKLKWRFDVNTFRLLGRDLITDRITALFELVKNSYDANAENVTIEFINVGIKNNESKIIIKDDGIGMTLSDIQNKWMVIGTNSKRKDLYSPEPYKRRYIGEKGIGRFAVDKLGQKVNIRTRQKGDEKELVATINWQTYQDLAEEQKSLDLFTQTENAPKLFTDIENDFEYVEPTFENGTTLEIFLPREIWTLDDIERAYKELSRLVSPFHEAKYPFKIFIKAIEYEPYFESKLVEGDEKRFSSSSFELTFDKEDQLQEYLFFDIEKQKVIVKKKAKQSFGLIKFYLYYFDAEAKDRFNIFYKQTSVRIDGIKIYRDGILTTPFAEYEAEDEKRRDVLGINKRRWRATFDRMGTRDCIGFIEITKDGNPEIIDSTNRQDFLNTIEYRELKDFIYEQLDVFMKTRKVARDEKTKERLNAFDETKNIVDDLQKELKKLRAAKTEKKQAEVVAVIVDKFDQIQKGVEAITTEYQETKKEEERKEKMYFSLMSLSSFSAKISHVIRTTIATIKDNASYITNKPFTEANQNKIKRYASDINVEMHKLLKVVDFMLKYARTDLPAEDFGVEELLQRVFDVHSDILLEKRIEYSLKIEKDISLYGNKVFFQDIITNLISNSIKALEGNFIKKIQCTVKVDLEEMIILFSDNGIGIPGKNREKVFDIYFTTTQEQGGAGMGLYIVQTNLETYGGVAEVIDSEFKHEGTTIQLTIPFKK